MSYATSALTDLLDAFAANDPAPGGGSASALAGALGVSLLIMVAGVPRTRTGAPEEAADLAEASARLRPIREQLTELIDRDSDAYRAVIAAYRLPNKSESERSARREAIRAAMRAATNTPLETLRLCQQALEGARVVAQNGAVSASSDARVALELLVAATRGAAINIDTNLPLVKDDEFVGRVRPERQALEADAIAAVERARAALPELP
jgi:formiminotetrahydrofolate cyclodeaminase